jgi:hypothetical protein
VEQKASSSKSDNPDAAVSSDKTEVKFERRTALVDFSQTPIASYPVAIEDLSDFLGIAVKADYDKMNQAPVGLVLPRSGGGAMAGLYFMMEKREVPVIQLWEALNINI